jgi:predicted naringenin-chalcone synthase
VRSQPDSKVLIVNLELCTLHLQETDNLEQVLSFLIFADGCAASIVSADPIGLELQSFHTVILPNSSDQITWHIGDNGFDMVLSGKVAKSIAQGLPGRLNEILDGAAPESVTQWVVHPGGRSILDAVQDAVNLSPGILDVSRDILRRYGNMSSATIMFVLKDILAHAAGNAHGCAMGFGPGVTVESLLFQYAGS